MGVPTEDPKSEWLQLLVKASSKDQIRALFADAFDHRRDEEWPDLAAVDAFRSDLGLESNEESKNVLLSVRSLVRRALFLSGDLLRESSVEDPKAVAARLVRLFPNDFHGNLRDLLVKLLAESLPGWRRRAIEDRAGLPRLADFRWRVDAKASSDRVNRIGLPVAFVQFDVEQSDDGGEDARRVYNVEFSQAQMNELVDGLSTVKNQLEIITKK